MLGEYFGALSPAWRVAIAGGLPLVLVVVAFLRRSARRLYSIGFGITAFITFAGSWIYCIAAYGFLLGGGLGWLPSLILAIIVGALWPLIALAFAVIAAVIVIGRTVNAPAPNVPVTGLQRTAPAPADCIKQDADGRLTLCDTPDTPAGAAGVPRWSMADQAEGFREWANAIADYEGGDGDRIFRNNNPGNLKFIGQPGALGADKEGFARFGSIEDGYQALENQLRSAAGGSSKHYRPDMTIEQFVDKYAADSPQDQHDNYVIHLANRLGVDPDSPISDIISGHSVQETPKLGAGETAGATVKRPEDETSGERVRRTVYRGGRWQTK